MKKLIALAALSLFATGAFAHYHHSGVSVYLGTPGYYGYGPSYDYGYYGYRYAPRAYYYDRYYAYGPRAYYGHRYYRHHRHW